jgi:hypothetical protein
MGQMDISLNPISVVYQWDELRLNYISVLYLICKNKDNNTYPINLLWVLKEVMNQCLEGNWLEGGK